jgi:hypothetical protein
MNLLFCNIDLRVSAMLIPLGKGGTKGGLNNLNNKYN